jgi:probable F420-dependent oxidoreductase
MKFGISFANAGAFAEPELASVLAKTCEEVGVESVWTVEHAVIPADFTSAYPYSRDGKLAGNGDSPVPDPLVWLAFLAGQTTTLRLATGILILPQRNPLICAKEVATLDRLSGGRVSLGIGVGWLAEEFAALGVSFDERGKRTDEYIDAMRALWTGRGSYEGRFADFPECIAKPTPVQPGGVPIIIGGHTDAAARRAGLRGDGLYPGKGSRDRFKELVAIARAAAVEVGRDPDRLEFTTTVRDRDTMHELEDMGFSRFLTPPPAYDAAGLREGLHRFADEVMATY